MCVPSHLCRNSETYKLICAVYHQKLKPELTWQPGTTQNYSESCFQLPLDSTQNATHRGRSKGSHVSPAVGLGSFWMQGDELLARGPAVVKRGRLEEIILKAQGKWSLLPRPLTAAQPRCWAHTGIFLPNQHMNRRGGKAQLKTASQQSKKEKSHTEQEKNTHSAQL